MGVGRQDMKPGGQGAVRDDEPKAGEVGRWAGTRVAMTAVNEQRPMAAPTAIDNSKGDRR